VSDDYIINFVEKMNTICTVDSRCSL